MRLTAETTAQFLRSRGLVPKESEPESKSLGGGVSNGVFRIEWDDEAVVVKQPLPELDVDDEWPADIGRVHNEAAAARIYDNLVNETGFADLSVPAVRLEDRDEHILVLTAAPESARMWKSDLLQGQISPQIGATLGEFLSIAHEHATGNEEIRRQFSNYTPFEQLRLEPYHETVAERHRDVAPIVEREVNRLKNSRTTLVHGDYSPKNVLVDDSGSERRLWLLDFEVAHWGDPVFDIAFMLNHLCIKSVYNEERSEKYVSTAEAFWSAYTNDAEPDALERSVVTELGVLMLARVDGKSPVEYVQRSSTKQRLRRLAKRLLTEDDTTLEELFAELR